VIAALQDHGFAVSRVLHPTIGSLPSSSRAAAIVEEAARSAGTSYN
jgi:hypothetical protein